LQSADPHAPFSISMRLLETRPETFAKACLNSLGMFRRSLAVIGVLISRGDREVYEDAEKSLRSQELDWAIYMRVAPCKDFRAFSTPLV
jgi:hypothetical protein